MATQPLSQVQRVNLRDIWPHEAHNFTTWLAQPENLNLLGDVLGLRLIPEKQEARSGSFSLDILAKNTDDNEYVTIENQLEMTNHSHLGQSITYAAAHEAGYVVWIASRFQPEHRAAIDWLNSLAPDKVWFFGVEIHAIQIGDSRPAADFRLVAVPKKWNGSAMPTPIEAPSPTVLKRRSFFSPLVTELEQEGFGQAVPELGDTQYWFPHGHEHLWYALGLDDEGPWVCLWIQGGVGFHNRVYESLRHNEEEIAGEIGSELVWYDSDSSDWPNVTLAISGAIDDPPERLDEIRAWMLETLTKFRDVFNPRLEKILAELETE